jgi:hypothetical protein
VDRLQTDKRGAGREVRPQAAPDRLGVTREYHPIDEPVTAAVSQLSLGKALTEPAVGDNSAAPCNATVPSERPRLRELADLFQQARVGGDGIDIERHFRRTKAVSNLIQWQKCLKHHVVNPR